MKTWQGNASKDRFMSVVSYYDVEPSSIFTDFVTLQLPPNWNSEFSGFLLSLRASNCNAGMFNIDIKQEMSTNHSKELKKYCERDGYERVGYVSFSSLGHIPWFNSTSTQNISFQTEKGGLNVALVRSKSKVGDLDEHPNDYSKCWDEDYKDRKTFAITYDSESSVIQISWDH
ncbi:hypothetical protein HanOQP8_Chr08g0270631 [Helianthus annuus]|nr:hypothetical protein HanOQP8_Chr08g0270631 [Helianthus annuus]